MNTNHYPDIERCKKLTEIGFPDVREYLQEHSLDKGGFCYFYPDDNYDDWSMHGKKFVGHVSYPSVMEMLDVIPKNIRVSGTEHYQYRFSLKYNMSDFAFVYYCSDEDDEAIIEFDSNRSKSLPNALVDLIFWLHENNYIKF